MEPGTLSGFHEQRKFNWPRKSRVWDGKQWIPSEEFDEKHGKDVNPKTGTFYGGTQFVRSAQETISSGISTVNKQIDKVEIPEQLQPSLEFLETAAQQPVQGLFQSVVTGYNSLPEGVKKNISTGGATVLNTLEKSNLGYSQQFNLHPILTETAFVAAETAITLGGSSLKKITQEGIETLARKNIPPSAGGLVPVSVFDGPVNMAKDIDLAELSARPLKSASDVRPVGRLGGIETLIDKNANSKILKKLKSKHYDQLDAQYQYVTPENLAKDPDTLRLLREREVVINEYFRDYDQMKAQVNVLKAEAQNLKKLGDKKGSAAILKKAKRLQTQVDNTQRELYDFATHNIYSDDMRVYGTDAIRTKLRQKFLEFKGKKWHHIFGNKEAGEYMLSAVAQDPIMTVNLMKHLEKLNLPTSGVARNIAIMEDALHTSWHKYMRKEGYEPTGFIKSKGRMKRAPLDPSDYGKEISKAIIEGKADPNELFTFLDVYAKYYKEMLNELTTKYQGKVVADMPDGVGKVLMSHRYKKTGGLKVSRGK